MSDVQVSDRERVAHVLRRLSMGPQPNRLERVRSVEAAIEAALDLSTPAAPPMVMAAPTDPDTANNIGAITPAISWWIDRMRSGERLIEERLVWFWHDHFATSLAKVRVPYLMWQQHLTIRAHATGNFGELLHAVARDPAMLIYLDGVSNAVQERNENFGRELLELFTMGRDGGYTEADVVSASRAFTGWTVNIPGRRLALGATPVPAWSSTLAPRRFDAGSKTLLGVTGLLDAKGALDAVLDHPSTAEYLAAKLYRELVGITPRRAVVERLAKAFRRDYEVMPLVEAIVADDSFASDAAIRAKYRSPIEKLVAILQAVPPRTLDVGRIGQRVSGNRANGVGEALRTMSFLPFLPPNVAGFPKGVRLAGPQNLVHGLDLLQALGASPSGPRDADELWARFGIVDVSDESRAVVRAERDRTRRIALVAASPELMVV